MSRLLLEKAVAQELSVEKETNALNVIAEANSKYKLEVSFSGGKDSLVVLDLADRLGMKNAVFVDTTLEFDETVEYVERMRDFFSSKIDTIQPEISFYEMITKINFPSRRYRWCCDIFKNAPLAKYAKEKKLDGFITGLRKDESFRRRTYNIFDDNPIFNFKQINPILDWNKEEVIAYVEKYNLPLNPMYGFFDRIGCWMCPYKGEKEWDLIKKIKPEMVKEFENNLKITAEKMKISDIDWFIKERGWTYYVFQTKRNTVGLISPCSLNDSVIFRGSTNEQIRKITNLLPILSLSFKVVGKSIRINAMNNQIDKIRILIEKALNCVGCGTCIARCPNGALYFENGDLKIHKEMCSNCLLCLKTTHLRGACIMRNYNPLRNSIEKI